MKKIAILLIMLIVIAAASCKKKHNITIQAQDYITGEGSAYAGMSLAVIQKMGDNVKAVYDGVLDDYVLTSNIENVVELDVKNSEIKDLTGIEDFASLTHLNCSENQLTSLDVSNNTSLERLFCDDNQLTSLDVSNNTSLEKLDCSTNQLTNLDVSYNTSLTELNCQTNPLTCVKVNQTQLDDIPEDWEKDPEDTYSLDCNES